MLLRLREDISVRTVGEDLELHGPGGIKIKGLARQLGAFFKKLEAGLESDIKKNPLEQKLVDLLNKNNLLTNVPSLDDRNAVWESHFKLQNPLKNKSVLVIGCGGTGAIIADHLSRCGLGKLGLIDGANLDAPDLNRQFTFRKKDLGRSKTELLKEHIQNETDTKVIEARNAYLSKNNLDIFEGEYDLVINCADRPKYQIQALAIKLSNKNNCPALFGSVGISDYVVGPLLADRAEKVSFAAMIKREAKLFNSQKVIKGSNALLNSKAAIDIATKAYEYLVGIEKLEFKRIEAHA